MKAQIREFLKDYLVAEITENGFVDADYNVVSEKLEKLFKSHIDNLKK